MTADAAKLAQTHYENFPVGSFLIPRAQRPHMHRVYAFARTADDIADELRDADALAEYRAALQAELAAPGTSGIAMFTDLGRTIRELELPKELFFALLDAFAEDLERSRHSRESLLDYCTRSADPVGRIVLGIFGYRDPRLEPWSDAICTGLQLINHLQDVREDLEDRDRIYLPTEDLERLGIREADLRAATTSPELRQLVREWTDDSAARFAAGWPLIGAVSGRLRLELRAILAGAGEVIRALRRIDYDVLGTHIRLGRWAKIRCLSGALFGGFLGGNTRIPRAFRV